MILKALYDYYQSQSESLPSFGSEFKEIEYVIVIDEKGEFKRFESKRIDKKRCAQFIVAKAVGRTSGAKSNILWDNGKYVLGLEDGHAECNNLFIEKIKEVAVHNPDDISINAMISFYDRSKESRVAAFEKDPLFAEIKENLGANFAFQLEGDDELIAEKRYLFTTLVEISDDTAPTGVCLITGEKGPLVRLTTSTAIAGNTATASLVGMQQKSGYDSYGKEQAYNSPISVNAEFAYTSALKKFLDKESKNKLKIGSRTYLFWGKSESDLSSQVETDFYDFLNLSIDKKDDPKEKVDKVTKLFKSIWSGKITTTLTDRFYILSLAPNIGRIAVTNWSDQTLKEFAGKILEHFNDMEIVRKFESDKPYVGIYSILSTVTLGGKISDALPNLSDAVFDSIINGKPYPFQLYTGALERIRAELPEHSLYPVRAAILKAYLNRKYRNNQHIKQLNIMLDKSNNNAGYLCGRLVAVLEKVQEDVKGGDSIRTRYLGAASTTPSTVFPAMLNLTIHHSEKLSDGSRIFYEQLKQEIICQFPSAEFPTHLDLNDQGRFFVGYYHQRNYLFTKKENKQ